MDKCKRWARKPGNRQSGRDGELADGQWNQGGDQASEGHQQKCEGRGNHQTFAAVHIVGAGFADVEIQWNLARQFELYGWIAAPQLIFKRGCNLVKLGNERLRLGRRLTRAPREQTFRLPCPGKSDRATRDGRRLRTRRVPLSAPPQWLPALARLPRNPRVEVPGHQDHAVDKWRMKTSG